MENWPVKFKVTGLRPHLPKVTGQFFNWPKSVVLSYLSMQVLFCCFFQVLFHSSLLGQKNYWLTKGRLPNLYLGGGGGGISNKASGAVFFVWQERMWISEEKSSIRLLPQADLGTIMRERTTPFVWYLSNVSVSYWQRRVITIDNHVKIGPLRKLTCEWKNHVMKTDNQRKNHAVDRMIDSYTFQNGNMSFAKFR